MRFYTCLLYLWLGISLKVVSFICFFNLYKRILIRRPIYPFLCIHHWIPPHHSVIKLFSTITVRITPIMLLRPLFFIALGIHNSILDLTYILNQCFFFFLNLTKLFFKPMLGPFSTYLLHKIIIKVSPQTIYYSLTHLRKKYILLTWKPTSIEDD